MKKVFIQILKALGYFAVYLTAQNLVSLVINIVLGYQMGREAKALGLTYEQGLQNFNDKMASLTGIMLMVSAILALITFFIIEKVKKTSIVKETDIKKVSVKQGALIAAAAVGGMFFLNFIMNFLPIPSDVVGELSQGMSKLSTYPFWQAMLANALLIPILEEVVFRGYIFSRLDKAMPSVVAAIISSLVFGLCHGGILWASWAFVFGMIICVARIKTGSIIPGMIFHIIMNIFGTVTSYFPIFDNTSDTVMTILTIAGGVVLAGAIAGIILDKNKTSGGNKAEVTVSSAKM